MDKAKRISELLHSARTGGRPLGMMSVLSSCPSVDLLATVGIQWLMFEQEHQPLTGESLSLLLRAAEARDVVSFVKVKTADPLLVRDALDFGACGVVVPLVETVEQISLILDEARFPPVGKRTICGLARQNNYGVGSIAEFIKYSNESPIIIPMIESELGIENLDGLLALPGFEVFGIGVLDLALALGMDIGSDEWLAETLRIVKAIVKKMHAAKKLTMITLLGIHGMSEEQASETMVALGNDMPYWSDASALTFGARTVARIAKKAAEAAPAFKQKTP